MGDGKALANGYRTYQHWDEWLAKEPLGVELLEAEEQMLARLLAKQFGKHALVIGVPEQRYLLKATQLPCHSILTPLISTKKMQSSIEGDFHDLPILTGSIDLVILAHTLEFAEHPRQLLAEACRIIKPEGLIAICGFNPYSAWGMKRFFTKRPTVPWSHHYIHARKIKNWLHLADFQMEKQTSLLFTPPFSRASIHQKLHFLERIGSRCFPFLGGAYILLARAKVIPLTPIRLKWKQHLNQIRISSTISGHIARHSK